MGISADTAIRLAKVLGTTPEFWVNLQSRYDILTTRARLGATLEDVKSLHAA